MRERILYRLLTALSYALTLALALAACGPKSGPAVSPLPPSGGESSSSPPSEHIPPQSPAPASSSGGQSASPTPQELGAESAKAYRKALEGIYFDHTYPNGDPVDVPEWAQMENNSFTVFDVDGDGERELVFQNSDSTMAGMMTSVYSLDLDTGKLYLELSSFVSAVFYDNGIIWEEASHNHGLSGRDDFWPFTLYQYDLGGDGYLMIGSVDAWDKDTFPADYQGTPFPDEIDQDGDGLLYLVTYSGQEVTTATLDGPEYEDWLNAYVNGAARLELPWQAMTLENIQAVAP